MDHSQDRMVDDPEQPDVDSRTLVAALTQLLLEDPTPTLTAGEQAEPDLRSPNHATDTADATLREITSSRSFSALPDERETSPSLPAFLSDSQVRTALQRANSLRPQGHLSDEPQFPSSLTNAQSQFQADRDWREAPARPPYPIIGYTDSSYPSNIERPGVVIAERPGALARFVPGQETASVLKITKRPRLRPKDLSHRQSLGRDEKESSSGTLSGENVSGFASPPFLSAGSFPRPTPSPESFMVDLAFGQRKVTVPGSLRLSVDELHFTAGAISNLDPTSILLMVEGVVLIPGSYLGDYPRMGLTSRVVVNVYPASTGLRNSTGPTVGTGESDVVGNLAYDALFDARGSINSSFVIMVVFEDGTTMRPVVWGDMQVRYLCQLVATHSRVSPDTVFLQFAGSILDAGRSSRDPPEIRAGARVYAYSSIERALHGVLRLMQGGEPPPSTPPGPQHFGPTLPPGYVRPSPPTMPEQPTPPTGNANVPGRNASITRTTASDKLRSTFKCPKFLGEARHWKVWNQGFVRFLSINQLDHVLEEDFLTSGLTLALQEDNKLVFYILEDAVAGSTVAAKYVRRAALWNGNEAYYLLYAGFALSGPAHAAILLAELSNFRFNTDETASEVVLRLQELYDDLESLPGTSAMILNDTQKINYLLSAIRPERSLAPVYSMIQTQQVRGLITFDQACDDLQFRAESLRADDLLHAIHTPTKIRGMVAAKAIKPPLPALGTVPALITSADKRQNRGPASKAEQIACLAKGCDNLTSVRFRLCKTCYHECISGKTPALSLKTGDTATFDVATQRIIFPPTAGDKITRKVKAAVSFMSGPDSE